MSRIALSPHFYLDEFTVSQTAERFGIGMIPSEAVINHLRTLCRELLQPLREALGPVVITSGYRPLELNRRLGSADTSAHVSGRAADIKVVGYSPLQVCQWFRDQDQPPYDQLILEFQRWTHVSVAPEHTPARHKALTAQRVNGRTVYHPGLIG